MDEDFLKIGDHICLYTDSAYGYLTSLGFNSPDVYIQSCSKLHCSHTQNVRNMVFQIVPKLNYDAMRELRREHKLQNQKAQDPNLKYEDKSVEQMILQAQRWETLERRKQINHENNLKYMADQFGQKVYYGHPIQLMHVDSGYFLQHAKKISQVDRTCQQLELVETPSIQRVVWYILPRYRYRQDGEPVVYNDHVILYNQKYNAYIHVSEDLCFDQEVRIHQPSDYRPNSPRRRQNPDEVFKRYDGNISQNFYKWQIINYRQVKSDNEVKKYLFSGEVIVLKHAETAGYMCFDDQSAKRAGQPIYVRIYKGSDDSDIITTNNLFEIEQHNPAYNDTVVSQGSYLQWKSLKKGDSYTQIVRLRHLNSGQLLTVKPVANSQNEDGQRQFILTLGANITAKEINERIDRIKEIEEMNQFNMDFNPKVHPEILALNKSVSLEQVFEIENTIMEPIQKIKNLSVVKIRNLAYNVFISTDIKKLDGEAEENEGDEEEAPGNPNDKTEELGGGGFADTTEIGAAEQDKSSFLKIENTDEQAEVPKEEGLNVPAENDGEMLDIEPAEGANEEGSDAGAQDGKFAEIMVEESDFIIFNKTKMVQNGTMDDVYILQKYDPDEVKKILYLQSCVPKIKEFVINLRANPVDLKPPYIKIFEELLVKMVFFVTKSDSSDPFTCEGVPKKEVQKYMRELKIIDLLMDILIYPFEGENQFDISKLTQRSPIVRICQLIYRLLKHCAKDNEFNKFYVAQWISHFFDQSMITSDENNLMAELTITELLADNKQLLDKQINSTTIKKIVQNCSENPKNDRSINLLAALCQCNGEAITSNQDHVCQFLLEHPEFEHLLIQVEQDSKTNKQWAIFSEPEILAQYNGRPLRIQIEEMQTHFASIGETRLYNYFIAMIDLISLMCLNRNYAGINKLQELYPLDFAVECFLNPNISYKLRSNFAKLLISLHIDKDPLEYVVIPVLTRVWQEIAQAKTGIPQSQVKIDPKLLKLKDFVIRYFEDMNGIQRSFENEQNLLTLQVLIITEKMIQLGFYQTERELLLVLEPMISLLDGSNDFHSREEEEAFKQLEKQLSQGDKSKVEIKRDKTLRYKNSEDNMMIVQIKRKIIQILHKIMDLQNDIRLTRLLIEFHKSDQLLIKEPQNNAKELKYLQNVLLNDVSEEDEKTKQEVDEKVIRWMKASYKNKNIDMVVKSVKKNLVCILLDIILYHDNVLVNSAFTLLTRYFQQQISIIKYSNEVQLLQDQQEVAILRKVSGDLRQMKKDAENSEFWIGQTDLGCLKKARTFIDKLEMLTDLCIYRPNRVIDIDDKKKKKTDDDDDEDEKDEFEFLNLTDLQQEWDNEDPKICIDEEVNDEKNQRLLRNLRAHDVPIIIIKQQGLEDSEDKNSFLKVLEKAYIFLIKFVRNNKENQHVLIEYLDLFIDDMEYGVHSWELISEIFKNSELLLSHNYFPLIKRVIKLIDSLPKETQKKTTMLSFLNYFMKYNGNTLKETQFVVCMEITSVMRKNCDHLFTGELGLKDLHLYILEMKNAYQEFMNDDRYVQEIQIPPELSYTIEYIKILAYAGEGKNAGTETRAQEKLPVNDIIENMKLADFCFPLKSALTYFMDSIYFDIEKDVSDENIQKMFSFLEIISDDLERFIEIQQRLKQKSQGGGGKSNKRVIADKQEENEDLDGINVDINKNFTMLTSFGSFPILYLIEKYIYENVYMALTHYFNLRLPIKQEQKDFFSKFIGQIQKATNFVNLETHKQKARELYKVIKKIPQLKEYGGDTMSNKNLIDRSKDSDKQRNSQQGQGLTSIPQMSQAQKLKAYMKSVATSDALQDQFEIEFEGLVVYVTQIGLKTEEAFGGTNTLVVEEVINSLIKISDIQSDIEKTLRIVCLKVIRKVVELENKKSTLAASTWDGDWVTYAPQIKEQQLMLNKLNVVNLICNLISYEQKLAIKEEALNVSVAILIGGNPISQANYNSYVIGDEQNRFMLSLKDMIFEAFEMIKKTQIKRNNGFLKLIQIRKKIEDLETYASSGGKKAKDELNKAKQEMIMLEEDLKDTEYDINENPASYTTDELTVARAIKDFFLCVKLHQLFCENHNLTLQNTIRQQLNDDRKPKQNSFDFPTFYAKMLEQCQKVFNNNTSDIVNQLVETLTESIQGPCKLNQKALVQAKILDSSREYIAGFDKESDLEHIGFNFDSDDDKNSMSEFKQKIVGLLTSLLEGEVDKDIMMRMAFSLDFNVMKDRMLKVFVNFAEELLQQQNLDPKDISLNKLNKRLEKDSFDGNIAEAFEIYILMHSLADSIPEAEDHLERSRFTTDQWKAFEFIRSHMGRIEISVSNNLQRIYFPIRPVCHYLSIGARKGLMTSVDRESQATKVTGLMEAVPNLIDEMNHNEELSRAILQITPQRLMALKDFSTVVGMVINSLYLLFARKKYHYREMEIDDWVIDTIQILGQIQGISSGVLIFFYAINKKRLITQKMWREFVQENNRSGQYSLIPNNDRLDVSEMSFEMTHNILMVKGPDATEFTQDGETKFGNIFTWSEFHLFNLYFFIHDGTFQYYVLYFGFSILGYLSSDIYYSFHLLDVINRIPTLQNVIRSVTSNFEQLSLTCMLLIIIVYIYSSLTFFYIQDHMYDWGINAYDSDIVGENFCQSMFQCFVSMLDKGLRAGGGIGDKTESIHFNDEREKYFVKLMHDATFHIVVKVILLNVLFGIIIDTFAQLRDEKAVKDNDMLNVCFICNHPRLMFDKYAEGMEKHIEKDHNLWNYVYYVLHLYQKDFSDHNGIESWIFHKVQENDISWIPRQKAMCLENFLDDENDDQQAEILRNEMKAWVGKANEIVTEITNLLDVMKKKEEGEQEKKIEVKAPGAPAAQIEQPPVVNE